MKPPAPGYTYESHPGELKGGGVYLLILYVDEPVDLKVGALGEIHFESGTYIYTGSAKSGLANRISRHFRKEKKLRWHIDHLTVIAPEMGVWWRDHSDTRECDAARFLDGLHVSIKGFGSSDCGCGSHLFFTGPERRWLR